MSTTLTVTPGSGWPILPRLRGDLAESRSAEVASIDGDDGRALGAAVAFERANAEVSSKASATRSGSFSAPTSTYCRLPKLSGEQRRM